MHLGLRIDWHRLEDRINALADVSPIDGGGNCRLALTDDDKNGRDLVLSWMQSLNLEITIDVVGNIIGIWNVGDGSAVMSGSHIDTVRTGGRFDGCYGVLAALEVIETCQDAGISPPRPLAVGIFTDEEGARFAPDMLGSLVYVGGMNSYASAMRVPRHVLALCPTRSLSFILSKGQCSRQTTFELAR